MYDAIIVGARCAGSPTAMLLARQGYRVLLVDRASFPSDTLSTHGIQQAGIARLHKWGLLDAVRARTPDTGITTIHLGEQKILPPLDPGVPDGKAFSPRRYILDQILLDAAIAAGAEVRTEFTVDDLVFESERVVGIRGHERNGEPVEERARIVVGADGKHSFVARRVGAQAYHERPAQTLAYFSYFSGVGLTDTDLFVRDDSAVFGWPTNDGLSLIGIMRPIVDFPRFRAGIEQNFMRDISAAPSDFADRVQNGHREERIAGSVDLPNFFRQAHGRGWVLAGDAGYTKDPITALGISDAFRAAEQVAEAIDEGLSGKRPIDEGLGDYQRTRDEKAMPLYQFTLDLASFKNARGQKQLIETRIPAGTAAA